MRDESSDPWVIVGFESWMLERSIQERARLDRSIQDEERLIVFKKALTESAILHARILCELFADPEGNFASDIALSHLLPDWDWGKPKYELLNGLLSELEDTYGRYHNAKSRCWVFNKILAHASLEKPSEHDYILALDTVLPLLRRILVEIQSERP
jgi:hypothetical protein